MKKKLVLKKWAENVLMIILFIMILIASSDCDDTTLFALTHIISGVVTFIIGLILMSYGRESD